MNLASCSPLKMWTKQIHQPEPLSRFISQGPLRIERSLQIFKFTSYDELRSELAHLFALEGQLEDPKTHKSV